MRELTFISPSFKGRDVAIWLDENVCQCQYQPPLPYCSSFTTSQASYRAFDNTWFVDVSGGGIINTPYTIIVTLPDEHVEAFNYFFLAKKHGS